LESKGWFDIVKAPHNKILMKNTIKTIVFVLMFVGAFPFAQAVYYAPGVQITDLIVTPTPVDFSTNPSVAINYKTNAEAYITLTIFQGSKKAGTFVNNQKLGIGAHAYYWNGKYGSDTQVGTSGEKVPKGIYSFTITAVNSGQVQPGISNQAVKTGTITVEEEADDNNDSRDFAITDVDLDNDIFDPWDSQEVEITFEMNDDAEVTIEIYDEDDDLVRELIDSEDYDEGDNSVTWNGEDDDEDIVPDGDYTYKIQADNGPEEDEVEGTITVEEGYDGGKEMDDPNIENAYITKKSFDPEWEYTYIIFTLTSKADITVDIYDEDDYLVETIYDQADRPSNTYKIKWEGEDIEAGDYVYKISVENNEGKDSFTGDVDIDADEANEDAPNIYKDKVDTDDIPYSPKGGKLPISFRLSEDADEVTIEIRHENKSIDKVLDQEELEAGNHTVEWDGKTKSGTTAEEGIYEYKIIAKNSDGTDTEKGYFSVLKSSSSGSNSSKCAGFPDVSSSYKYCEAITWTKEEGIFTGYPDNSFKPYQPIRRSEILKVVLEAFGINLIKTNGGNIGFKDVKGYEWFMNYLSTSMSLGIIKGYDDNTFKPDEFVTRAQAFKIMMEAAKKEFGLAIPSNNFGQPYIDVPSGQWYTKYAWIANDYDLTDNDNYFFPLNPMTRGEMADVLYRFHQEKLDQ